MDLTPPKGMRDFLPSEAAGREFLADSLRRVFQKYGFLPLETPVAERFEVLSSKFAGGAEILKETYRFKDQGGRELSLRYDLTVPLCRVFAANPQLPKPFKRYQIAPVFRDGPLKKGRYREFVQCDVDTVGVAGVQAEAELLALGAEAFQSIGLDVKIKVNNRKLLNGILEDAGIQGEKQSGALLSLDKLEKIGEKGVLAELQSERGLSEKTASALLAAFAKAGSGKKALAVFQKTVKSEVGRQGLVELCELFALLDAYNVKNAVFSPELSRGLNYYTGTVYEVFLEKGEVASSLAAGGRYDNMIGDFSGREKTPAVGISFGLDVIGEALSGKPYQSPIRAFVMPIGETQKECIQLAQNLRSAGVNVLLDLAGRGVSKNLKWAAGQGIAFAVIIGEKEVTQGKFTVRDLTSGTESHKTAEQLAKFLGTRD